jgi:hypothetical protein
VASAAGNKPRRRRIHSGEDVFLVVVVVVAPVARIMPIPFRVALVPLAVAGLAAVSPRDARRPPPVDARCAALPPGTTRVAMRHVALHVAPRVVLDVRQLEGTMRATTGGVVDLDEPQATVLDVSRAEIALDGPTLSHLMNDHVFAYAGAPIRHVAITIDGGVLRQRGTIHKGVDIPFEMTAQPTLLPDGRIRLHPIRLRIFDVDGRRLMRALHVSLASMLDLSRAHGVSAAGDDLVLDPMAILPAPAMRARVTALRIDGHTLVQTLGPVLDAAPNALPNARPNAPSSDTASLAVADSAARNYMAYRCGTIRFGKMTMADAELLVVDADPSDPFDFDEAGYQRQLVAGYSRTLPSLGLEVFMPDAAKLGGAAVTGP